jgi:hypothetical protein
MIEVHGPTYKYKGEQLDKPEFIWINDHCFDEEDQCFHVKRLLEAGPCDPQSHTLILDHIGHDDVLSTYNTVCFPIFLATECEEFIEQNIVRDWSNKTHIFNFSINKSRIHRYLLLEEIKRLNLTQYTYSLPWLVNNVNDIPVTDYKFGPETQLPTAIKNGKFKNAETYDKLLKKTVFEPSCISIITEPCYFEHEAMVTEKTFMAMMGGTIPLWFGGWKNAQSLKQYGFDVFDDIVYHGYETLEDPRERCVQALERNLHLFDDIRLLKTWLENNKTRLQHNVDLLLDNVFLKKCFDIIHTSDAELKRALLRITPSFLRQKITADIEQYIEESEQLDYQRLP